MNAPISSIPELFALFQADAPGSDQLKKLVWLLAKCSRTSCDIGGDIEVHEEDLRDYDEGKPVLLVSYNSGSDLCGMRIVFKADDE